MAKSVGYPNSGPVLRLVSEAGACGRCGQPEDLRPDQQAAVLRLLARRYTVLLDTIDPAALVRAPFGPGSWSAMEHADYMGAMLEMAYIRLLMTEEGIEPVPAPTRPLTLAPGDPQVQQVIWRISTHADHLARTIACGSTNRDWRVAFRANGGIHEVLHRAIDESTEHLHQAQAAASQTLPISSIQSGSEGARVGHRQAPAQAVTDFAAAASEVAGKTIVSLRGELDMASALDLRRVLDEVMETGPPEVLLDLRALTFADGSGVREFARAWRRAELEGRRLTLRAPGGAVRKVLGLSRLDQLMVIEEADAAPSARSEVGTKRCNRSGSPEEI